MENNFLFVGVGSQDILGVEGIPISIIKKLVENFKIKNTYAVVFDNKDSIFFKETVNLWDAFRGKYPSMDEIPPIDRKYENPIAHFSVEILHQIARHGDWDFEKRLNLYYTHLRYWDNFLNTRKINYVVFTTLPHESYDYIIYLLCREKGIKTCMNFIDGYKYLVTPKAYYMLESIEEHTIEAKYVFEKYIDQYRHIEEKDISLPEYTEQWIKKIKYRFENAENSSNLLIGKGRVKEIKRYYANPKQALKNILNGKDTFKNLIRSCYRYGKGIRLTKRLIKKYESLAVNPDFSDKYFFYALHYQPEASSSPLGGIYANQLLAIQLVSHNLPEGYWIYVKEHPDQTSFCRSISYYDELAKISKVKIISQKVTSEKLMKNALAMITLTGTVMFEAQIIQKPCLCFGYTPWTVLNGIYQINTNEDCIKAIHKILNNKSEIITLKNLKLYLLAMEEVCFSRVDELEFYNKLLQFIHLT